jgi:hypothetical protein
MPRFSARLAAVLRLMGRVTMKAKSVRVETITAGIGPIPATS